MLKHPLLVIAALVLMLLVSGQARADATGAISKICPSSEVQQRTADFQPGGIILTAFDKSAIWVYNIDSDRRYPLPDTAPCSRNCHLSPDATSLTYFNDSTNAFNIMHVDGTGRTFIAVNAAEVGWWNPTTYLIWTPGKQAYLLPIAGGDPQYFPNTQNVTSIEPNGRYGVMLHPQGDGFERFLVNLDLVGLNDISDGRVDLGPDQAYFDAQAWSPDGSALAFVSPVAVGDQQVGGELFGIKPGDPAPTQWTNLTTIYGAERINGVAVGQLSWSPDGTKIAFWVTPISGADVTADLGSATIHVLDVNTGALTVYCGYSTVDQTPNPPNLVWSPDGTYLAFGGALPHDESGYYLLALDTTTGTFTALSKGVYPVLGSADVIAWGKLAQ